MLNKNLDLQKIKEEYSLKKRIAVPDFLDEKIAEEVYRAFTDLGDKNLWYQANHGNPRYYNPELKFKDKLKEHFAYRYEKFPLKNISLTNIFKDSGRKNIDSRYEVNPEMELAVSNPLRIVSDFLDSKQVHDIITMITGAPLTYFSTTLYATNFLPGDFLAVHNDSTHDSKDTRRVAFILNMTKNWLIHWGGNLVIIDDLFENIIEDFVPKFNQLVLFDVPLLHAVMPVSLYAQSERFAISGWYRNLGIGRNQTSLLV